MDDILQWYIFCPHTPNPFLLTLHQFLPELSAGVSSYSTVLWPPRGWHQIATSSVLDPPVHRGYWTGFFHPVPRHAFSGHRVTHSSQYYNKHSIMYQCAGKQDGYYDNKSLRTMLLNTSNRLYQTMTVYRIYLLMKNAAWNNTSEPNPSIQTVLFPFLQTTYTCYPDHLQHISSKHCHNQIWLLLQVWHWQLEYVVTYKQIQVACARSQPIYNAQFPYIFYILFPSNFV